MWVSSQCRHPMCVEWQIGRFALWADFTFCVPCCPTFCPSFQLPAALNSINTEARWFYAVHLPAVWQTLGWNKRFLKAGLCGGVVPIDEGAGEPQAQPLSLPKVIPRGGENYESCGNYGFYRNLATKLIVHPKTEYIMNITTKINKAYCAHSK